MKYAFFPGCALSATALPYGMSFREVAHVLDMDMPELRDWNCCGSTCFQSLDEVSFLSLSGRNLAIAEKDGNQELVTPCAGCFAALGKANYYLTHNPQLQQKVGVALSETGLSYGGSVRVRHLLDVMANDVGLDAIKAKVTQPLTGLKVVCYYGCLLTRPPAIASQPHHEYPVTMDRLVAALGMEPLDWSSKTDCCGASFALPRPELAAKLVKRILDNAREVGAEMVVVACPLCHANLDTYQAEHTALPGNGGEKEPLPIVYFTQLMGIAFGLPPQALGLNKHFRDPVHALRQHSFVN